MGYLDKDIDAYALKLEQLRQAKADIEAVGLVPGLPAISRSAKIAVILTDRVEVTVKKIIEGPAIPVVKIVGYGNTGKDGAWYDITDLVPYTDAARILYLK